MSNELLLISSIFIYFGLFIIMFKYLGKLGIFVWIALASVLANIEVLLVVKAFSLEMTLGNILFSSIFLATDLLSERYSQKDANIGLKIGVITSILYIICSQFWMLFTPVDENSIFQMVFASNFRILAVGLFVFYVSQKVDIFLYHIIWNKTTKLSGDKKQYLWVRNIFSTLTSQVVNSFLFTYLAYAPINLGFIKIEGLYDNTSLIHIFLSAWIIMSIIALIDTPFMYLCRKLKVKEYEIEVVKNK